MRDPGERAAGATATAASPARPRRWVHGPWVDFLTLGGGSFLVLGAMAAFFPRDETSRVALAGAMLFLAHFVNHPHFAHSYQIFYKDFRAKAFSPESALAARYRFAGILVPVLLAAFFAAALAEGSVALLGLAANVMLFTVGWHYAKQGYGILMLDAARKGLRFGADERRRLLWNTHLVWVTFWLATNDALSAKELWGITYYLLDVPDALLVAMVALVAVSTLAVGRDLFATWRAERTLPLNGLLAYVAAAYVWLAVGCLDPVLLLVVPFFHSLQYMAVVWRYQLAAEADRARSTPDDGREAAPVPPGGGPAPLSPAGREAASVHLCVKTLEPFPPAGSEAPLPPGEGFGTRAERATPSAGDSALGPAAARIAGWKAWLGSAPAGLARFIVAGGILGFAGFWLAPGAADTFSGYDRAVFGATLFLFIGWTFINIHHYFIDNVIWRRENPEARRYLFGGGTR